MANFRYFAEINGEAVRLDRIDYRGKKEGHFGWHAPSQSWVKVRAVIYKPFASKHECDARCMNASGRTMNCECSCGGKNHGRGFIAEAA
jgi:alpha-acetolactate decarboxylase